MATDTSFAQVDTERDARSVTESDTPAVSIESLVKTYGSGDGAVQAVDSVSFEIEPGTVVGLLGPNGAGKTTVIKSVLGLVVPTGGNLAVRGVDPVVDSRRAYEHVAAVLEGARNVYWRLTVRENLDFFAALGGRDPRLEETRDHADALVERLGLADEVATPVRELSRGMKQRTALACALVRDTPVLFLDEPTLGLDVGSSLSLRRELRRLVETDYRTIVLSSHDMDVIEELCDRVIVLDDGRIVADDTVDTLIDAFRTRAYEVTLDGADDVLCSRIEAAFDPEEWRSLGDGTRVRFTVVIEDAAGLHELTGILAADDATVVALNTVEPDFERVFLELTGGSK